MPHTPQVKEHIRNGETYQINYTFNLHFTLEVDHGLFVEHSAPYRSSQHPPAGTLTWLRRSAVEWTGRARCVVSAGGLTGAVLGPPPQAAVQVRRYHQHTAAPHTFGALPSAQSRPVSQSDSDSAVSACDSYEGPAHAPCMCMPSS